MLFLGLLFLTVAGFFFVGALVATFAVFVGVFTDLATVFVVFAAFLTLAVFVFFTTFVFLDVAVFLACCAENCGSLIAFFGRDFDERSIFDSVPSINRLILSRCLYMTKSAIHISGGNASNPLAAYKE